MSLSDSRVLGLIATESREFSKTPIGISLQFSTKEGRGGILK